MDRVLALDEKTGNALTAFLPAEDVSGVPDDAPMPAALVAVRCGRHLLLVFDRFRLTTPPRSEYAAVYTARTGTRHQDFVPNEEISAIRWWDTTESPPGDTQIIDATLATRAAPLT